MSQHVRVDDANRLIKSAKRTSIHDCDAFVVCKVATGMCQCGVTCRGNRIGNFSPRSLLLQCLTCTNDIDGCGTNAFNDTAPWLVYHGAGPIRTTFWYGQCAEWNANFIEVATTYELIIDKYLVLCVGVVVPVQETRPRQRSRWPVKSHLGCQGSPYYLPTQRTARRRAHKFGIKFQEKV